MFIEVSLSLDARAVSKCGKKEPGVSSGLDGLKLLPHPFGSLTNANHITRVL